MDLEELKKKKMQEYLSQTQSPEAMAMEQMAQAQQELKKITSRILTTEAMQRINNIRHVKPDFALQVELYIVQLYQAGQIKPPLNDSQLKSIINPLVKKQEWKIRRK